MNILYRLLGVTALISSAMTRFVIHIYQLNILILGLLWYGAFSALQLAITDASHFGKPPVSYTVQEAIDKAKPNDYVTLRGELSSTTPLELPNASEYSYYPFEDVKTKRALYIGVKAYVVGVGNSVTGVLREPDGDTKESIDKTYGGGSAGSSMDRVVLNVGETPSNPQNMILLTFLAAIPALLMTTSLILKHVIFEKEPHNFAREATKAPFPDNAPPFEPMQIRYSGSLTQTIGTRRRFLNVPATLFESELGDINFETHISRKPLFKPKVIQPWGASAEIGTLDVTGVGYHYVGWNGRPALRLQFPDNFNPIKPVKQMVVISFESEEQRDYVQSYLEAKRPTLLGRSGTTA